MGTAGRINTHHGEVGNPMHTSWVCMKKRCYNKKVDSYQFYGGRGIKVYEPWHEYKVFAAQVRAEIGEHPGKGFQLDRVDNDSDYCPGNIQWATAKQNTRNRRSNTNLTYKGKTQCISAWAEEKGWGGHVIHNRIKRGWSLERILETPLRHPH